MSFGVLSWDAGGILCVCVYARACNISIDVKLYLKLAMQGASSGFAPIQSNEAMAFRSDQPFDLHCFSVMVASGYKPRTAISILDVRLPQVALLAFLHH